MKSKKTVERYGRSFQIFDQYADYQRSIASSILQIGELSGAFRSIPNLHRRSYPVGTHEGNAEHGCTSLWRYGAPDDWQTVMTDILELKAFCMEQIDPHKK